MVRSLSASSFEKGSALAAVSFAVSFLPFPLAPFPAAPFPAAFLGGMAPTGYASSSSVYSLAQKSSLHNLGLEMLPRQASAASRYDGDVPVLRCYDALFQTPTLRCAFASLHRANRQFLDRFKALQGYNAATIASGIEQVQAKFHAITSSLEVTALRKLGCKLLQFNVTISHNA